MAFMEREFNAIIVSATPKREDSKEEDRLNGHLKLRIIDEVTLDAVATDITTENLAGHLKQAKLSMHDWLESVLSVANSVNFGTKYEAHAVTLLASGKKIADFGDCSISGFSLSQNKGNIDITFKLKANSIQGKEQLGPVNDFIARTVRVKIKRAKHWQEQEELPIAEANETEEDKEAAAALEKAKETANKANTDKARKRTAKPKSKPAES